MRGCTHFARHRDAGDLVLDSAAYEGSYAFRPSVALREPQEEITVQAIATRFGLCGF